MLRKNEVQSHCSERNLHVKFLFTAIVEFPQDSMDTTKQEVVGALDSLTAAVHDFVSKSPTNGEYNTGVALQRQRIVDAAKTLVNSVNTPDDEWVAMLMQVSFYGAARLFYEWKGFEFIPAEGSVSYAKLAAATETEEALLRMLSSIQAMSVTHSSWLDELTDLCCEAASAEFSSQRACCTRLVRTRSRTHGDH